MDGLPLNVGLLAGLVLPNELLNLRFSVAKEFVFPNNVYAEEATLAPKCLVDMATGQKFLLIEHEQPREPLHSEYHTEYVCDGETFELDVHLTIGTIFATNIPSPFAPPPAPAPAPPVPASPTYPPQLSASLPLQLASAAPPQPAGAAAQSGPLVAAIQPADFDQLNALHPLPPKWWAPTTAKKWVAAELLLLTYEETLGPFRAAVRRRRSTQGGFPIVKWSVYRLQKWGPFTRTEASVETMRSRMLQRNAAGTTWFDVLRPLADSFVGRGLDPDGIAVKTLRPGIKDRCPPDGAELRWE